jgi:hypothetical protein
LSTNQETLADIDREAFRARYDEAVAEINIARRGLLTTEFYSKTGAAVFSAGYAALSDWNTDTRRMLTLSAPAGAGKTSFSYALMMAVTRNAENDPAAPYGCAYVVDQISKADDAYSELNALLPGKVAVWTTEHDVNCKEFPKLRKRPAAQFDREALRLFPVVIVTHQFYLGPKGHKARNVIRNGLFLLRPRALTIVDERPKEVDTFAVLLSEAQSVREALQETHPEAKEHLDDLLRFMEQFSYAPANGLFRPGMEIAKDALERLAWFNTSHAERIAASAAPKMPGTDRLFAYARALLLGVGFVATDGGERVKFVGYSSKLTVNLSAGTILLDATADIDGISRVVLWQADVEVPQAHYDNLEIIQVPQHTTRRLSEYFKKVTNRRAYADWMEQTIKEHMKPGEKGLVVCKQALFENQNVPTWPQGDPRFDKSDSYTQDYEWDVEGRKVCAIHWGTGIGSNAWQDADVVFLFDEFFIPRSVAVATTQGYREHRVDEGDFANMKTLTSQSPGVEAISEGHRLRWSKQLALRGRARTYDEHGMCGKQRLVVACELRSFMANVGTLFPGAHVRIVGAREKATWSERVIDLLNRCTAGKLLTSELAKELGKPWGKVSFAVLTPEFFRALGSLGWRYVSRKGRGGSYFERARAQVALAA